jgi:hypothetical protein
MHPDLGSGIVKLQAPIPGDPSETKISDFSSKHPDLGYFYSNIIRKRPEKFCQIFRHFLNGVFKKPQEIAVDFL